MSITRQVHLEENPETVRGALRPQLEGLRRGRDSRSVLARREMETRRAWILRTVRLTNGLYLGDLRGRFNAWLEERGCRSVTLRRVEQVVAELQADGLLETEVLSLGRRGVKTRLGIPRRRPSPIPEAMPGYVPLGGWG